MYLVFYLQPVCLVEQILELEKIFFAYAISLCTDLHKSVVCDTIVIFSFFSFMALFIFTLGFPFQTYVTVSKKYLSKICGSFIFELSKRLMLLLFLCFFCFFLQISDIISICSFH